MLLIQSANLLLASGGVTSSISLEMAMMAPIEAAQGITSELIPPVVFSLPFQTIEEIFILRGYSSHEHIVLLVLIS